MNRRLLPLILIALCAGCLPAQETTKPSAREQQENAVRESEVLHAKGVDAFMKGDMKQSVAFFDRCIELVPAREPHHWQRGLAHYYAELYEAGVNQFVSHQDVNGTDVENAVWHFLCLSKLKGTKHATTAFYPFAGDRRVPMKEVHALFAGTGKPQDVLDAATRTQSRNDLCYAHLYLGLWHEAYGRNDKAKEHMRLATTDYRMTHYMGEVARIHYELRWKK